MKVKVQDPHSAFADIGGGGVIFSVIFRWIKAVIVLNVFHLARLPPSKSHDQRESPSAGAFFSLPIGVSGLPASSAPSLGYVRSKANSPLCHSSGLAIP